MAARSSLEAAADGRKRRRDMEAEIIQTKAHASRLEIELSELKKQEKIRRLTLEEPQKGGSQDQATRLNQLERERKELILELNQTRKESSEMKEKFERNASKLEKLQKSSELEKRDLQLRLSEAEQIGAGAVSERDYLKSQCRYLEDRHSVEVTGLRDLCTAHEQSIATMRGRIKDLEQRVEALSEAETDVELMQKQLTLMEDETRLVKAMSGNIRNYSVLESQNRTLTEDNRILVEACRNNDLLKYQVAMLEDKVKKGESLREDLAKLQVENEALMSKLAKWEATESTSSLPASPQTMVRQLAELQQSEILLKSSLGERDTELKIKDQQLSALQDKAANLQGLLDGVREEVKGRDEQIKRLERKLVFVTKERDGNASVLSSYKLDAGVNQQVKNVLEETEASLSRAHDRVKELEEELEESYKKLSYAQQRGQAGPTTVPVPSTGGTTV